MAGSSIRALSELAAVSALEAAFTNRFYSSMWLSDQSAISTGRLPIKEP
jgi:hypothetical protein